MTGAKHELRTPNRLSRECVWQLAIQSRPFLSDSISRKVQTLVYYSHLGFASGPLMNEQIICCNGLSDGVSGAAGRKSSTVTADQRLHETRTPRMRRILSGGAVL